MDSLAAVSLPVFPALAPVITEAASVTARPFLLTHMSKTAPVTLVTALYVQSSALTRALVTQAGCRMEVPLAE